MKMRNLLFGVILGLLAVVRSTPVDTMTQIPTKTEDEVYREAVTDGFLVEPFSHPSLTTESPKRNTTVQASRWPSSDSTEGDVIEDSAGETSDASTTSVSLNLSNPTPSSTSTVVPGDTGDSSSDSTTTQSTQSSFTTSSVPNEARSSVTPDHISVSPTTDPSSDSGSGEGEMFGQHSTTASTMISSSNTETSTASTTSNTETSTASTTSVTETSTASTTSTTETSTASSTSLAGFIGSVPFSRNEGSSEGSGEESGSGMETSLVPIKTEIQKTRMNILHIGDGIKLIASEPKPEASPPEPQNKGHSTPGWIIILGFIVGVAALVMLCVAIATRDKWNGPSQAKETKTKASNQQRGLEMETFLHKADPKENGNATEYTVIPLDELPEKYSSH